MMNETSDLPPLFLRKLSRRRLLALAAAATLPPGAARAAPPRAAVLDEKDYADVRRVQDYLNGIRTLQSRFDQIADNGGVASGEIYLQRPGRMRIQYDPPVPILMVATDGEIFYYDKSLQQVSRIEIDATPAWFLLRSDIRLGGDVTITGFKRAPGVLRVTLVETRRPDNGRVTLVLSDHPLELRQWTVIDAQNKPVTVTLIDPQYGGKLDPNLFYWTDPRPAEGGGG